MPAVQTSYAQTHARWVEGMVLNSEHSLRLSRTVESAAGIGFGKVACRGADDHGCKVSAASGDFIGITIMDQTLLGGTVDKYPQYAEANLLRKGVIVVSAGVAVTQGDPVYFVPATGVLTNTDNSAANIQIPNAEWETTRADAGLAALRLL